MRRSCFGTYTCVVRRAFNAVSFSFLFFSVFSFFLSRRPVVPDDDDGREWWSKERKPAAGCLLKTTQEAIGSSSCPRLWTITAWIVYRVWSRDLFRYRSLKSRFDWFFVGTIKSIKPRTKVDRKVKFGAPRTSKFAN